MRRTRIDGDQAGGARQQRHQPRNRQIIGGVVQARDIRQRRDFLVQRVFGPRAQQHDGVIRTLQAHLAQHLGPALVRPILVIDGQAAQAAPHRALVADLNQDQRRGRKTSRLQPRVQIDALGSPTSR